MNWGWSIVWVFIGFATFIGYLAVRSFQTNVDLVAEDYYQQELEYQQQIEKTANAAQLEESLKITQKDEHIIVHFPEAAIEQISGTISLFRPSDARFDHSNSISLNEQGQQRISTEKLLRGYYKVKVDWATATKDYYWEKPIFLR